MLDPLRNGEGRAPRQLPGLMPTTTATYGTAILPERPDQHCLWCACRCGCHRPRPELPVRIVAPQPGEPFYSAWLAEGRVA